MFRPFFKSPDLAGRETEAVDMIIEMGRQGSIPDERLGRIARELACGQSRETVSSLIASLEIEAGFMEVLAPLTAHLELPSLPDRPGLEKIVPITSVDSTKELERIKLAKQSVDVLQRSKIVEGIRNLVKILQNLPDQEPGRVIDFPKKIM